MIERPQPVDPRGQRFEPGRQVVTHGTTSAIASIQKKRLAALLDICILRKPQMESSEFS